MSDHRAISGGGGALPRAARGGRGGGRRQLPGLYRHKPHLVYAWAQELIRHPKILDAVEDVIGPDILAWEPVFFTKEPQTEDYISWHQDITYWGLEAKATWSPPGWR